MSAVARAQAAHAGIRAGFLARGGTPAQWASVAAGPRKFNRVWHRLLGLPDSTLPPPAHLRAIDPGTGEMLGEAA